MADNIVFDTIPSDTPLGGIFLEIDPSRALEGPVAVERKVLLMGQKLDSGTTPLLTPRRITSAQDAEVQFGRGSMLHRMALGMQAVFDEVGFLDVSAIALEDTGVAASVTITVAGQAIESRVLNLYIAGEQVQVVVASGEDAAAIAKKINTVLAARTDLPVSSAVEDKVVTLTARNKGETGNGMEVAWQYFDDDRLPRGITVTISGGSNGVGALDGGSGAPDVAAALAAVDEQWFYTIISPYTDQNNLAKIEADMNGRWGGMNMKTGHVFNALNGTHAELTTFGNKRNSAHGSGWGLKGCPTWAPVRATCFGLTCQYYGNQDPALPLKAVKVPGVRAPRLQDRFNYGERTLLVRDGISTTTVNAAGEVYLERVVTYYQQNALGLDDTSLSSLEAKWTVDYYRYQVRARIALRFPRHKLVNDGTNIGPGQKFVTPQMISDEITALERDLEEMGIVEDVDTSKKNRLVLRSKTDPDRVNAVLPPNLVNQFRTFAAVVQYRL
ncbi:phage tail sheath C-terminal domain-containing protein [Eikenella sp. NML01-A-086]|uniref:phage tail sheath C-terminal domain-containing protein n=1 Tax=Eikenella sp. NML01-A-086 TaxID=1795826 RepID=UPI0007E23C9D|nr:phage tail sheath C-terminal domain-containing protein [Eikenella sp. NML01-A-086]OAM27798.1 phage tail protein [Eikenella sp. NML01-A-086]